jgi:hypothetical protein
VGAFVISGFQIASTPHIEVARPNLPQAKNRANAGISREVREVFTFGVLQGDLLIAMVLTTG